MGIVQPAGGGVSIDSDGNVVVAGPLIPTLITEPLVISSTFKSGGPDNAGEGIFFRIVSDNLDFDNVDPSDATIVDFDEWNGRIRFQQSWPIWLMGSNGASISHTSADGLTGYGSLIFDHFISRVSAPTRVEFYTDSTYQWQIDATGKLIPQNIANVVAAEATDPASTTVLANSLRAIGIALGIFDAA